MQDDDFYWFIENYDNFCKRYGNAFIVIKNKEVLGVYSSFNDGVDETLKTEAGGTFIVQECNTARKAYNAHIASNFTTRKGI